MIQRLSAQRARLLATITSSKRFSTFSRQSSTVTRAIARSFLCACALVLQRYSSKNAADTVYLNPTVRVLIQAVTAKIFKGNRQLYRD